MKQGKFGSFAAAVAAALYSTFAVAAVVDLTPAGGAEVRLHSEEQRRLMAPDTVEGRIACAEQMKAEEKASRKRRSSHARSPWRCALPVEFGWRATAGEKGPWELRFGKKPDLSDAWVVNVSARTNAEGVVRCTFPRQNFEVAATYYWSVTSSDNCGIDGHPRQCVEMGYCKTRPKAVASAVASFRTEDLAPRWIEIEGRVANIRDLGGRLTASGRRVRQGLVYRGQGLNDNSINGEKPGRNRLTVEDVAHLTGTLGIRTDLDLRGIGEVGTMKTSPLGAGVAFVHSPSPAYQGIFTTNGMAKTAANFRLFCNPTNYPVYFHCIAGADRTGALAYVLNGALGVDRHGLETDWESTFYPTVPDANPDPNARLRASHFTNGLLKYGEPDDSWTRRIELYLKDCGITDAEIESFRAIMLEP